MSARLKIALVTGVAVLSMAAFAGTASATLYCVGVSSCSYNSQTGTEVASLDTANFQIATGPDDGLTDILMVGNADGPLTGSIGLDQRPLEIVAEPGSSPVLQSGGALTLISVTGFESCSISGITVKVPDQDNGTGIYGHCDLTDVTISGTTTSAQTRGYYITEGMDFVDINGLNVDWNAGGLGTAIVAPGSGSSTNVNLSDSTIGGNVGTGVATTTGGNFYIYRSKITTAGSAIQAGDWVSAWQVLARSTNLTAGGSVVRVNNNGWFEGEHMTIVWNDNVDYTFGVEVFHSNGSAGAELYDSLVMTPVSANSYSVVGNGSGSGTSAIDLYRTYSKKNFGVNLPLQDPVAPGMGEPEFVDAANGDFRLRGGQLAIDAAAGTDLDHDANGAPTPVDGDGNGTDVADLGAFEYQRAAPKVVVAGSNSLSPGVVGSFTATASDADGDAMTYAWDFGDGSPVDTSGLVVHHAYAAGRFILKFTATDAAGVSGVATTTIDVPAPPVTAPPRDTTPPNVTVGKFTANKKGTGFSTKVSCPATESKCAIKLSFTAKTGKSGKFKKYANDVSVSVPGGKSATVNVKLNSAALGVIKQKGKVAVKVVLLATDGDSNSTTRTLSYTAKKGKTGSAK